VYIQILSGSLISAAPGLVGWIVALIMASMIVKRGGSRAERFLLAGVLLMLIQCLLNIPVSALFVWLRDITDMTNVEIASYLSIYNIIRDCIGLAGIVCLVYAFWVRFWRERGRNTQVQSDVGAVD